MEIQQEVSFPIETADSNGNQSISQRRLDTEVAVQSGETIVLAGLIQTTVNESNGGLPFLARVPVVGGLFGSKSSSVLRTELLVLLSPTVVSSVDEAREVSKEYRDKLKGLKPFDLERVDIKKNKK